VRENLSSLMKKLLLIFLTLFMTQAVAEEYWACDGFNSARSTSKKGSFSPFLMKGDRHSYTFKGITGRKKIIKFVKNNEFIGYDLYVTDKVENFSDEFINARNADPWIIKPQKDGTIIFYMIGYDHFLKETFNGGIIAFITKCAKQ
jgi:hypothetical protein